MHEEDGTLKEEKAVTTEKMGGGRMSAEVKGSDLGGAAAE